MIDWTRPLGFLALLLPVALLVASRSLDRPAAMATGTLDIWRRVLAARPPPARGARRRIPPAIWLLAAALALGALALAGPRRPVESRRALRVLVDARPSTALALGAGTRRERAVEAARRWIGDHLPAGTEVAWLERADGFGPEDDRSDALWVTDRAPEPPPERAGFVASGGDAVPGPIAVDGTTRYDWDGERIVAVPDGAPRRRVAVEGSPPGPIAGVLAAWAGARGFEIGSEPGGAPVALAVRTAAAPPERELAVGRDGWEARAKVGGSLPALPAWLADGAGRALVVSEPGRVESAIVALDDPRGDPAAFAVSWAACTAEDPPPGRRGQRRARHTAGRLPTAALPDLIGDTMVSWHRR